jgi:hypothetical protein
MTIDFCRACGQIKSPEVDKALWDIYHRIDDGRSSYEPLVFTSDWLQENIMDEDDEAALDLAMTKDMHNRGLCSVCGRPDLRGVNPEDILSEEDAKDMADMYAEQAAERRAGC